MAPLKILGLFPLFERCHTFYLKMDQPFPDPGRRRRYAGRSSRPRVPLRAAWAANTGIMLWKSPHAHMLAVGYNQPAPVNMHVISHQHGQVAVPIDSLHGYFQASHKIPTSRSEPAAFYSIRFKLYLMMRPVPAVPVSFEFIYAAGRPRGLRDNPLDIIHIFST